MAIEVHCSNKGISVKGAREDIGSTCDVEASTIDAFLRIATVWWHTYVKRNEVKNEDRD